MKRAWLLIPLVLGACGDDEARDNPDSGGGDPVDAALPDDAAAPDAYVDLPYDAPEDFPDDGCVAGSLADVDLHGVIYPEVEQPISQWGGFAMRISRRAGGGYAGGIDGVVRESIRVTDDHALIRVVGNGNLSAALVCARESDGTLRGHFVRCDPDGNSCLATAFWGKPLPVWDDTPSAGVSLLGELGPWPASVFATGMTVDVDVAPDGIAYLARYQDGLRIVDARDPANMVELGHLAPASSEIWNDVVYAPGPDGKRYALMAGSRDGVSVVDVTDPAKARIVRTIAGAARPGADVDVHTVYLDGTRLYFPRDGSVLEIYDVANPAAPVRLGAYQPQANGYLHDMYAEGDRVYIARIWSRLEVLDVSNPASPQLIGTFPETSSHAVWVTTIGDRRIALLGGEGQGTHFHVIDVTEGSDTFMDRLAEWETRPDISAHNLILDGDKAYVAYYQDGLRVLDLADPSNPVEIGHGQTWNGADGSYGTFFFEGAFGVDLDADGRVYVADSDRGLMVFSALRD